MFHVKQWIEPHNAITDNKINSNKYLRILFHVKQPYLSKIRMNMRCLFNIQRNVSRETSVFKQVRDAYLEPI